MATNHSVQFAGGDLGGQRHICAFFNSIDEEHRVLRSFFKDGFDRGERATHIVDPAKREDHLKRLAEAGINVQQAMDSGQLELRPWRETYLRGDRFDQDAAVALIEEILQSGAAAGYALTRLVGHMEWALLDKPGVHNLLEYEMRLNYVLPKYNDPVVCTYDLSKFPASLVMDIMRTHPVVIIGGILQENPFFVPPDQLLLELRERSSVRKSAGMAN
jgi:MEDS: MEthanogen/methylotroph, DcmR Sensory domain